MSKRVNYIRFVIAVLTTCCLFYVQNTFGQLPTVKTSIDKNDILIGQQLHYKVASSMPDNRYRLTWFLIPDSLGHFTVITKNKIDSSATNGNLNFSQEIILTSFDSGRRVIPPLTLTVSTLEGDSTFNLYTDSIPVNVSYSPMDSILPFHDIKTIMEVKDHWPWWVWALFAGGLILLIGLVVFLVKLLKKKKITDTLFDSNLSPFDEAMESLSALEKEFLIQNGKVKEYHTRLSGIFKRFLSRKMNTYKLHLTSDEILMELNDLQLPKGSITDFANCLKMGNAVKFAQYIPPAYENEKCLSQTREIITAVKNMMDKVPESDL